MIYLKNKTKFKKSFQKKISDSPVTGNSVTHRGMRTEKKEELLYKKKTVTTEKRSI